MKTNEGPKKISDLFSAGRAPEPKPPAHQWQDLSLRIIAELGVPNFKRSSVFKICRDYPKHFVEKALNDTKELCQGGIKWKYFFKVVSKGFVFDKEDKEK